MKRRLIITLELDAPKASIHAAASFALMHVSSHLEDTFKVQEQATGFHSAVGDLGKSYTTWKVEKER